MILQFCKLFYKACWYLQFFCFHYLCKSNEIVAFENVSFVMDLHIFVE
jgi:hypothetical protein